MAACSLEDTLKFLGGPTDEHKFAGLLLVPKVCAESGSVRYKEIYETLGLDFLWRLLVPLRDPRFIATIDDAEDVQKQLLGVTLSLSVLSILTREPAVAQDPELVKLFPCLARILRSQSLADACGKQQRPSAQGELSSEAADAVDTVWNVCTHEDDAVRIALESRLLSSVAAWLSRSFLVQPTETLNCAVSLLFIIAQPLLQSGDGYLPWYTDKVSFPPDMLASEVRAAVEGLTYVCSVDCSVDSAVVAQKPPGVEDAVSKGTPESASASTSRKELQLQSFSALAALLPAMQQCPEHGTDAPSTSVACDGSSTWVQKLQKAALRALKSKLAPQHTMNVLIALHALTQQHGATALLQHVDESDSSSRATDLMVTLSQVVRVDIYSHLQGCSLEVQAARASKPLPSHLLASQSSFSASVHMIAQLVELAVTLDSSADDMNEDEPCSSDQVSLVHTAAMEGTIIEMLFAIKDSVKAMLDFILLCVRGDLVDGPDPEQIPKGFRKPEPVSPAQGPECTPVGSSAALCAGKMPPNSKEVHSPDSSSPQDGGDRIASFMPKPDPHWVRECLQQCCQCAGCFLSMAGDETLYLQLFEGLPALCGWMLGTSATGLVEHVPGIIQDLMKPLLPTFYSVHVLRTSEPAVLAACEKAFQHPEVIVCMCICCKSMAQSVCVESDSDERVWKSQLVSPIETICELLASVLSSAKPEVSASADALHAKLHALSKSDESDLADSLMQETSLMVHKLVCTMAPALPAHADKCEDADEVTAVVDTIVSTAELMLISAGSSVAQHQGQQRWIDVVSCVVEALRIAVEFVLRVVQADYTQLVRSLVSSGHDSTSCWSGGGEHLLFACVTEGADVSRVADRCANLCSRLCACLEGQEVAANQVCERTWFQQWLRSNEQLYQLVSALESSEATVSLGHSLRLLAVALQS